MLKNTTVNTEMLVGTFNSLPGGIPTKSTLWAECTEQTREGDGHDKVEEPSRRRCKRHANVTDVQRERLGRIGKRNWAFTGRVDNAVEIDTKSNDTQVSLTVLWDPESKPGHEQKEGHEGECRQEQISTTKGIDGVYSRNGKGKVD